MSDHLKACGLLLVVAAFLGFLCAFPTAGIMALCGILVVLLAALAYLTALLIVTA